MNIESQHQRSTKREDAYGAIPPIKQSTAANVDIVRHYHNIVTIRQIDGVV